MRLLDLYCGQGGATRGYQRAGFEVHGVDDAYQDRYIGSRFIWSDALDFASRYGHEYDAIHASPPCQTYSNAQRIQNREHPDLIGPTREVLQAIGKPWVIENVEDAPLIRPITLCGAMFGLRTYRHRLFEWSGFRLLAPEHPFHDRPLCKMGRAPRDYEMIHAVGNFSGVALVRADWGVEWMNRDGIREAIPPAYAEYIGTQMAESIQQGTPRADARALAR